MTVLEMMVLKHLEDQCSELREHILSRRAEMVGKLQNMGYGEYTYPSSSVLTMHGFFVMVLRAATFLDT